MNKNMGHDIRDLMEICDPFTPDVSRKSRRDKYIGIALGSLVESGGNASPSRLENTGTTIILGFPGVDADGASALMGYFRSQGLLESQMFRAHIGEHFGLEMDKKAIGRIPPLLKLLTEAVRDDDCYLVSGELPDGPSNVEPPVYLHRRFAGIVEDGDPGGQGGESDLTEEAKGEREKRRDPGNPWHDKDTGKFTSKESIRSKGAGSYSLKSEGAPQQVRKTKNSVRRQATKNPCGRLNKRRPSTIDNRAPYRCWDGGQATVQPMSRSALPQKVKVKVGARG